MTIVKSDESQLIRIGRLKYKIPSFLELANGTKFHFTMKFISNEVVIMYMSDSGSNILDVKESTFNKAIISIHRKLKEL